MGQLLEVRCRSCGAVDDQFDGAVMAGFQPRCVQCGRQRLVSIEDLVESDPPGMAPASREAWRLRRERIPRLAGTCDCGGTFAEDAPLRCSACRSVDVVTTRIAIAD